MSESDEDRLDAVAHFILLMDEAGQLNLEIGAQFRKLPRWT